MRFAFLIGLTLFTCTLCAQNYTRDVGIRLGENITIGYRQYFDDDEAVEAMISAGGRGLNFTILKEYMQPAFGRVSENISFIYGFGAHAGFRYSDHYRVLNRKYELDGYRFMPILGVDGYLSFEYRFPGFPFMAGIDFKPNFEYSNIEIFNVDLTGFGIYIKYRF